MTYSRTLLAAAAVAAPLSLAATHARAADIIGTLHNTPEFSKLAMAVEAADMAGTLKGGGPYTLFAPTNQAFEQLPKGTLDELLKDENKGQLEALIQYHVVEGKELMAKDAIGNQSEVATLEGGNLSVDGTGKELLLVPTGLTVTRIGDQVYVEREVAAIATPQVEVAPAGQSQQSQAGSSQQQATESSGSQPQSGGGQDQQQAASGQPQTGQSLQQAQSQAGQSQQQAAGGQSQSGQGQQQEHGVLREARVVEPDIQTDNGVIHAIDAVLVPQSVVSKLESMPAQQQSKSQPDPEEKAKQG